MSLPRAIYEPKGAAREYAALACNLYQGCGSGCKFCYVPSVLHKTREEFAACTEPRLRILAALERDAKKYAGTDEPVLLCFTCDPYPPDSIATAEALIILGKHGIASRILTKSGHSATVDFGILQQYDGRFGVTLTCCDEKTSCLFEPGAAHPSSRIESLAQARTRGIRTWASFEPVLIPDDTLRLIAECGASELLDEYHVGMLNHIGRIDPALVAKYGLDKIDWAAFAVQAVEALQKTGKPWRLKDALAKHLPEGMPRADGLWCASCGIPETDLKDDVNDTLGEDGLCADCSWFSKDNPYYAAWANMGAGESEEAGDKP